MRGRGLTAIGVGIALAVGATTAWAIAQSDLGELHVDVVEVAWPPIDPTQDATAVWTGSEFVVWGGGASMNVVGEVYDVGVAYDPAADRWRELAPAPLSPRERHTAVWTGEEMVVWGGTERHHGVGGLLDGARYDPATDTWRPMADSPEGTDRSRGQALVVEGEVVIGAGFGPSGREETTVLRYDLAADSWRTATASAPVVQLLEVGEDVMLLTSSLGSPMSIEDESPRLRVERLDRSTGDIEPVAELELADGAFTAGLLADEGDFRLLVEPLERPGGLWTTPRSETEIYRVADGGRLERLAVVGSGDLGPVATHAMNQLAPVLQDGSRRIVVSPVGRGLIGVDLATGEVARMDGSARVLCKTYPAYAVDGSRLFVWGTGDCAPEDDLLDKPTLIEVSWPEDG